MKLEPNWEIVGTLAEVESKDGITTLQFSIRKTYEIPTAAIDEGKLRSLVGERVGVFNCDGDYRVRRANKK